MNHIDKIREEINRDFDPDIFNSGDSEISFSDSKKYRMEATGLWCKDPHWDLTRVKIYKEETNHKIFDFFVNHGRFFHQWLTAGAIDYFICAEDIFGGQTVIDLTNEKTESYSPGEEGFIWTDFHLSPDGKRLATIGCYWGSPYFIRIFDFSSPLSLPLKQLQEIELLDNDEVIVSWLDNSTLKMKGIKREREPEYFEGGSMSMKTISETPIEREIKITVSNF